MYQNAIHFLAPHLWAIQRVAESGDAGKDLLHILAEGRHGFVAALPQQNALQYGARMSNSATKAAPSYKSKLTSQM